MRMKIILLIVIRNSYVSLIRYSVIPPLAPVNMPKCLFSGLCISYSDRICMCHPIGQFHKTGMDELGYRRVFFRYLGGTKYLLRFMAYNDLDNLE